MQMGFGGKGSGAGHLTGPDCSLFYFFKGDKGLFGSQFQIIEHHFKESLVARNWKQLFT